MNDFLEVFSLLSRRMEDIQMKIDAVILRLEVCEKDMKRDVLGKTTEEFSNPLDQYTPNYSSVESYGEQLNQRTSEQTQLLDSHQKHLAEKRGSIRFVKKQVKQSVLDSKSFGMIKRSILINSEQVEQMRQRMIQVQKLYINRINSVEEGVQILTRLFELMQNKMADICTEIQKKPKEKSSVKVIEKEPSQTSKIIQKYRKKKLSHMLTESSYSTITKYL